MKKTIKLTEADLTKLVHESVKRVIKEMSNADPQIVAKARAIFNNLSTKDFQMESIDDCVDPPYGYEGTVYAEVQDENGGWWKFTTGGCFTRTGADDYVLEDTGGDVDFETPDGIEGQF